MAQAVEQNTTTRRAFLTTGAALAVAGAVPAVAAITAPDPIVAAIEKHRRLYKEWGAMLDVMSDLEESLPQEKRRTYFRWGEERVIVETDDPRWIESEITKTRALETADEAAFVLTNTKPSTVPGALALLQYLSECQYDELGRRVETLPEEEFEDDSGRFAGTRDAEWWLVQNVRDALSVLIGT